MEFPAAISVNNLNLVLRSYINGRTSIARDLYRYGNLYKSPFITSHLIQPLHILFLSGSLPFLSVSCTYSKRYILSEIPHHAYM